jgi:hypothetical protein
MGADGSGYPDRPADHRVHPYSRIVAVADRYDRLLRDPDASLRPDQVLQQVLREAADGPLDAVAACALAQAVGSIPIGTTVRLTDHSVGIVRDVGDDPLDPPVRLVIAGDGAELKPAPDIELVEDEREVVEVLDGRLLDIEPSEYL